MLQIAIEPGRDLPERMHHAPERLREPSPMEDTIERPQGMNTHIEHIDVYPIRAPRKEAVRSGLNATDPVTASEFGIIRVSTAAGISGVGEISITYPRIGHTLCYAADRLVAPALIGL